MDFSEALKLMKQGLIMFRKNWNGTLAGHTMYVYLVIDASIRMPLLPTFNPGLDNKPRPDKIRTIEPEPFFIFHHGTNKTDNIWFPSTWDQIMDDWEIFEE